MIFIGTLTLTYPAFAQPQPGSFKSATEEDGSPTCFGWQLKFVNGNVTDNLDGTCSIADTGGSGSPGGTNGTVQFNNFNSFGGDNGFTFEPIANNVGISGALTVTGAALFNNDVVIDGSADENQLRIQGNATQTSDILVVENSAGGDILTGAGGGIKITGNIAVTQLPNCNTIDTDSGGIFRCGVDATGAGAETNSLETITTGIADTEIPIGTAADTVVYAALSGNATMTNAGVVTVSDLTCTDCIGTTEIADSYMLNTGDTSTGAVTITGSANVNQLVVTGNATQTADILVVEQSGGADILTGASGGVKVTGNVQVDYLVNCNTIDTDAGGIFRCGVDTGGGGNSFETIAVPAGTNPVADSSTDTLTITETSPLIITGTAASDTIDITWATLTIEEGGTEATSLTDGGILLGSGTGAITALGVATNGQIPIGDGATDPVLAGITGTASEITVTDGAGSITLSLPTQAKGWVDDGTEVRLQTSTDEVEIGSAATLSAKFAVNGDADEIQALIQGNATQTNDIFVVETSAGTDILTSATGGVKITGALNLTSNADILGSLTTTGVGNFADRIFIDGSRNTNQLIVQGNTTQTSDIFVAEISTGVDILTAASGGVKVTGNIDVTQLVNCDTIDTDSGGIFRCGSDATGGGGGAFSDAADPVVLNTTTKDVVIGPTQDNTSKLTVDGDDNQVQLTVQGNSTQTSDILVVENSAGVDILTGATGGGKITGGLEITKDVRFPQYNCGGLENGGKLTINSTGQVYCANDTGSGSASGWSDNGTDVNLTLSTDNVGIGGSSLAKLSVDGDTNEVQALIQGNSTQTSDILVVETSAGTDILTGATGGVKVTGDQTITGYARVEESIIVSGDGTQNASIFNTGVRVIGNASQLSDIFVVEQSTGTDILTGAIGGVNVTGNLIVTGEPRTSSGRFITDFQYVSTASADTAINKSVTTNCTNGKRIIGGGCRLNTNDTDIHLCGSYPSNNFSAWTCCENEGDASSTSRILTAYAICAEVD